MATYASPIERGHHRVYQSTLSDNESDELEMTIDEFKERKLDEVNDHQDKFDFFLHLEDETCKLSELPIRPKRWALVTRDGDEHGPQGEVHGLEPGFVFGGSDANDCESDKNFKIEHAELDIHFDFPASATLNDLHQVLYGRGAYGSILKIYEEGNSDHPCWDITKSNESDKKCPLQFLLGNTMPNTTTKLIIQTAMDTQKWPKRVKFIDMDNRDVRLPICEEHTIADVLKLLEGRGFTSDVSALKVRKRDGVFIYDAMSGDPELNNKRKTFEYITNVDDKDTIEILYESDDGRKQMEDDYQKIVTKEFADNFMFFKYGYARKQFTFCGNNLLGDTLESLYAAVEGEPEIHDVRVKSRSLLKEKGENVLKAKRTLNECRLNKGDVIEIIFKDSQKYVERYPVKLTILNKVEDGFIANKGGIDVGVMKNEILKKFSMTVDDDKFRCILFECCEKDEQKFLRPLFVKDKLPGLAKCHHTSNKTLNLWKNCEYYDLVSDKSVESTSEYSWPWGEKDNEFWIWGIKISGKDSKKHEDYTIFYVCLHDGQFARVGDKEIEPADTPFHKFEPHGVSLDADNHQVSMFISFLPKKTPKFLILPDCSLQIYTRLKPDTYIDQDKEKCENYVRAEEYWIPLDKREAKKKTEKWKKG